MDAAQRLRLRARPDPKPLENIETRDALIDWSDPEHPKEADWPDADVIIGNPPFLGGKLLRDGLGDDVRGHAVPALRRAGSRARPTSSTYWHEKARAMVEAGRAKRVGLLATQGIRGGANRRVLERIKATGDIFLAWSDEPWVLDGAAVHVSFVGFDDGSEPERTLDGQPVAAINANLTAGSTSRPRVGCRRTSASRSWATRRAGRSISPADVAYPMLDAHNPDGRSNRDVVRPVGQRPRRHAPAPRHVDHRLRDGHAREEAALYEAPFEYVERAREARAITNGAPGVRRTSGGCMSSHGPGCGGPARPRSVHRARRGHEAPALRLAAGATSLPDSQLIVFARDDDYMFGVLHSRSTSCGRAAWARSCASTSRASATRRPRPSRRSRSRARPTSNATPIAAAAKRLDELRARLARPAGLPDEELELRTLTNLYNERPAWLRDIHARLDQAVLAAYGWPADIGDDDLLERLLALNLERASAVGAAATGATGSDA